MFVVLCFVLRKSICEFEALLTQRICWSSHASDFATFGPRVPNSCLADLASDTRVSENSFACSSTVSIQKTLILPDRGKYLVETLHAQAHAVIWAALVHTQMEHLAANTSQC